MRVCIAYHFLKVNQALCEYYCEMLFCVEFVGVKLAPPHGVLFNGVIRARSSNEWRWLSWFHWTFYPLRLNERSLHIARVLYSAIISLWLIGGTCESMYVPLEKAENVSRSMAWSLWNWVTGVLSVDVSFSVVTCGIFVNFYGKVSPLVKLGTFFFSVRILQGDFVLFGSSVRSISHCSVAFVHEFLAKVRFEPAVFKNKFWILLLSIFVKRQALHRNKIHNALLYMTESRWKGLLPRGALLKVPTNCEQSLSNCSSV